MSWGNPFNAVGEFLNSVTGVNNSARNQFNNQMELQQQAQKWSEQTHQHEVADLEKAGLNPILSANNSGMTGVTEGSASSGSPAMDPISAIGNIIGLMNSSRKTEAEVKNLDADTENKTITNSYLPEVTQSMIDLNNANTAKTKQEKRNLVAQEVFQYIKNDILSAEKDINFNKMTVEEKKKNVYKAVKNQEKILQIQANKLGINNSEWKQIWDMSMDMVGSFVKAWSPFTEISKGGNEYNYNVTTNSPTVNY